MRRRTCKHTHTCRTCLKMPLQQSASPCWPSSASPLMTTSELSGKASAHTCACMPSSNRIRIRICTCTRTHIHTFIHTHLHKCAHTSTHAHVRPHKCAHARKHTHAHTSSRLLVHCLFPAPALVSSRLGCGARPHMCQGVALLSWLFCSCFVLRPAAARIFHYRACQLCPGSCLCGPCAYDCLGTASQCSLFASMPALCLHQNLLCVCVNARFMVASTPACLVLADVCCPIPLPSLCGKPPTPHRAHNPCRPQDKKRSASLTLGCPALSATMSGAWMSLRR